MELYVKNEKGEYKPYSEPEPPFDNVLYRKEGRKYVPQSMTLPDELPEGVWVISKHMYGKSYSSGMYLRDCFMCQKASDIQDVSLSKLGGMDKLADWLSSHWDELPKKASQYDMCRAIVGILFRYEQQKSKK